MVGSSKSRFEWLHDYLELNDEIRYLEWKIRKAKAEEDRWSSGDLAHLHLQQGSKGAHVMDNVPKYEADLRECKNEQQALLELIDKFSGYENQLLKLKYVDGLTLEKVAEKLGYSYSAIRKTHAELHRRLDFIDKWEKDKEAFSNRHDTKESDI